MNTLQRRKLNNAKIYYGDNKALIENKIITIFQNAFIAALALTAFGFLLAAMWGSVTFVIGKLSLTYQGLPLSPCVFRFYTLSAVFSVLTYLFISLKKK